MPHPHPHPRRRRRRRPAHRPPRADRPGPLALADQKIAVGETVIQLPSPLRPYWNAYQRERGMQQNDSRPGTRALRAGPQEKAQGEMRDIKMSHPQTDSDVEHMVEPQAYSPQAYSPITMVEHAKATAVPHRSCRPGQTQGQGPARWPAPAAAAGRTWAPCPGPGPAPGSGRAASRPQWPGRRAAGAQWTWRGSRRRGRHSARPRPPPPPGSSPAAGPWPPAVGAGRRRCQLARASSRSLRRYSPRRCRHSRQ